MIEKFINLKPEKRFVPEDVLRKAYLHYEDSLNPTAQNYINLKDDLELGIVSSQVPEIAHAVSSILTCSLEDAKLENGGYLPADVVARVQTNIISPHGVSTLWGVTGHRFVLSRPADNSQREIIASILVARSKDTIFFFTGKYNNIKHSELATTVDWDEPDHTNPGHKWFDKFCFPDLVRFKPKIYHQIANFVVIQSCRGQGLAHILVDNIVKYYSRDYILARGNKIEHSQHLLCGKGFWQVGDPPWLPKMTALGFYLRGGAESFFLENDWHTLRPVTKSGQTISNIEYNQSYGLPQKYENWTPYPSGEHLMDRIPEVIKLSQNPLAKLQYFQAMYDFL